jgi:hypothetical protein
MLGRVWMKIQVLGPFDVGSNGKGRCRDSYVIFDKHGYLVCGYEDV